MVLGRDQDDFLRLKEFHTMCPLADGSSLGGGCMYGDSVGERTGTSRLLADVHFMSV